MEHEFLLSGMEHQAQRSSAVCDTQFPLHSTCGVWTRPPASYSGGGNGVLLRNLGKVRYIPTTYVGACVVSIYICLRELPPSIDGN